MAVKNYRNWSWLSGWRLALLLLLISFSLALPWNSHAARQSSVPAQVDQDPIQKLKRSESVPGEILVRFRKDAAAANAANSEMAVSESGHQIHLRIEQLSGPEIVAGLRLARVNPEDTNSAIAALRASPDVLYAERNFLRYAETMPNDPRYIEQWALKNTGQLGGTIGADIKAEQAWDITTGNRSIVVGVVDQGIDINHPDLKDNIWTNPAEIPGNGIDDDGNGYVDDVHGWDFFHNDNTVFDGNGTYPADKTDEHGTHVAGTIGATGNNGVGVVGVNWQVSLMSLKFLAPIGSSADLLKALAYAKMMRDLWVSSGGTKGANIRILNNSYGGGGSSQAELDAINALAQSEILFVAAAGNDALDDDRVPQYPSSYDAPNIIAVSASDRFDSIVGFSNYGSRTVHMAAPGAGILSTTPNSTYSTFDGTSMAAPHVSGAAALLCAQYPNTSVQRLRTALMFGGDEKPAFSPTVSGRRLNVLGSLQNVAESDTTPPATISDLRISSQSGRSVTLQWTAPGDDGASGRASAYQIRFGETDLSDATQFNQAQTLTAPHPGNAGTLQTATVRIPYRHLAGFFGIRSVDNVGNTSGVAQVSASVSQDIADPYIVTESGATALSTGGTPLNLKGDDKYLNYDYSLPFSVKFYGQPQSTVRVSTNGGLYFFPPPPKLLNGNAADAGESLAYLNSQRMLAGMLDDLRTDTRAGDDVYVVTPDANRVIFRWQAVTFDGELPVNFEIELQRNGTIQMRYGEGNTGLYPVVGISDGDPDAYFVSSHSSNSSAIALTNAPTVTYTLRNSPASDVRLSMNNTPNPVLNGQELTYNIEARNYGPDQASDARITDQLPVGTTFVSCTTNTGTCVGPAVGTNGTVTLNLGSVPTYPVYFYYVAATITVRVTAPAGTTLSNTVNVTNYFRDPDLSNNSATVTADVFEDSAFTGIKAIAAGQYFTIALKTDGTILGWGADYSGQLGDNNFGAKPRPVQASALTNVIAIAAGDEHSLALKADGTVWSWGANDYGQLGAGDNVSSHFPVMVAGLTDVKAIAAGGTNSLALKTDGTVWAWGNNMSGQLGNPGYGYFSRSTPIQVASLSGVSAISMGSYHAMALKTDGTVWVWGNNQFGQLGFENPISSFAAVQVQGVTNAAVVSGGYDHSVIAKTDGTVWTWGYNSAGQLGDGTFTRRSTPAQINGISGAAALAAANGKTLALKTDGSVWAWGANSNGILGVGGTNNQLTPAPVIGLSGATAIAAGSTHSVALLNDGTVRTWGLNNAGQLGDGSTTTRTSPTPVSGLTIVATPTLSLAGGTYNSVKDTVIGCVTAGAVIHYTINGQDPTESDPVFISGSTLRIDQTTTVKVKAWKNGSLASAVNSVTYTIVLPANPIDDARNFVHQQYLDFLNREPDQSGWDYWTNQITQCGTNALCVHNQRIGVSAAFFIELEFQQTGSVVYRLYRASYGAMPDAPTRANVTYAQFIADRALLVGGAGLPQSTIDLANSFVQRSQFKAAYPDALTNSNFVNTLFDNANLTGAANAALRQAAIDAMNTSGKTRAQVLLDVIEIQEFKDREYKPAFVLMQYFGYLRRDPDQGGYDFWLNILKNKLPDDASGYRGMVCAFLTSAEYQLRFGSAVTRTDRDC